MSPLPVRGRCVLASLLGLTLGLALAGVRPDTPVSMVSRRVWCIESPHHDSVVQRSNTASHAVVVYAGLQAERVELNAGAGELAASGWTPMQRTGLARYEGACVLRPGWNTIALRTLVGGRPQWTGTRRVGVGEVFVVAGQSNAVGSAATLFQAPSDVRSGRLRPDGALAWQAGDDPQTELGGGSPWPRLGHLLHGSEGVPVGFINVAMGGTHIREWAVGGPLHARLVRALKATRPHGVRAVLWQHGETSTSGQPEADDTVYHDTLAALIADVRRIEGLPPVRWVVARVGYTGFAPHPGHRRAQERLWREGTALQGPDLDDLGPSWREPDRVHFNGAAQPVVADRWHAALQRSGLLRGVDAADR